jgi:predicted regulator of Ras-like GTPase activity (Roadblock/LC7/MglB family)
MDCACIAKRKFGYSLRGTMKRLILLGSILILPRPSFAGIHIMQNDNATLSSVTIQGALVAGGSAGTSGQVLISNGISSPPTFVDPLCSINVSSNNITVSNISTVTINVNGSSITTTNPLPVQSTGTTTVQGTVTATLSGSINNTGFNVNNILTHTINVSGSSVTTTNPLPVQSTGTSNIVGILSDNGTAANTNRLGVVPGISQTDYRNWTAATQGRDAAQIIGTDGLTWVASLPSFRPASYVSASTSIASAASATDIATLCGNPSNTVLVYGLRVSCTQTTAGNVNIAIVKRSAGYTGVWSTMTAVPEDSTYVAAQSTATYFTAVVSTGAAVGYVDSYKLGCMASATATPNDIYISPSDWRMKPIILRGSTQCLGVNLGVTTVTGGNFAVEYSWIETKTITP